MDVEEEVQKIRKLYYKVQNNLDKYEQQDGGGGITFPRVNWLKSRKSRDFARMLKWK